MIEKSVLLGCDTVPMDEQFPILQRNVLLSYSGCTVLRIIILKTADLSTSDTASHLRTVSSYEPQQQTGIMVTTLSTFTLETAHKMENKCKVPS